MLKLAPQDLAFLHEALVRMPCRGDELMLNLSLRQRLAVALQGVQEQLAAQGAPLKASPEVAAAGEKLAAALKNAKKGKGPRHMRRQAARAKAADAPAKG